MTGSTINTYVTQTVTIGSTTYPSPLTITAAGTVETSSAYAVYAGTAVSNASLVNTGTIINTGAAALDAAVFLAGGGYVDNSAATALISGDATGIRIDSGSGTVINAGTIQGLTNAGVVLQDSGTIENTGTAALITGNYGVYISGATGTVLNTGTIIGTGTGNYLGGILMTGAGYVANTASTALISGYSGIRFTGSPGTVNNAGIITASHLAGVFLGEGGSLGNTGTINGPDTAVYLFDIGDVTNKNIIRGGKTGVILRTGGTVVNTGSIFSTLNVAAAYYAVRVDGADGYVTNSGATALISGAKGGLIVETTLAVVVNDGTIESASGAGTGVFIGGSSGATVVNAGTAALISGYYGIQVSDGPGHLTNAGTIDGVSTTAVLFFDSGTVSNNGTAATIYGKNEGVKIVGTADLVSNTGTIDGAGLGVYLSGGGGTVDNTGTAALITGHNGIAITGATGTVLNEGTVSGGNIGVELADGGTINNTGTAALIYGAGTGVVVNTQAGTLNNTGTISAQGVAAFFDGGAYINNQNVITGGEIGVAIGGGGTVMNTGSIYSTSYSSAAYYAVYITGPQATIINSGTNALISSAKGGIFAESTMGVVANDGAIVSTTGTGNGVVVYETVASSGRFTVQNNGPAGYIAGYDGIKFTNVLGIVDNAGLIIGAQKVGVDLASGGTVSNTGTQAGIFGKSIGVDIGGAQAKLTNAGIISGNTNAVELYATTSNLLIADVGAEFVGGVAANKSAANTLELAQGPAAGPGAIYGIGSQFTGFGTIDFDAKTEWTLGGDIAGLAVGQVINGFTFGDTIDLSSGGLVAEVSRLSVSPTLTESFADNVLTLYSSGAEFAALTLNEAPSITSANFEVFSDGNGGTDIVMDMPCFCTGTKILTPTGQVNVEDLQVGDTVITVRDNGPTTGRVTWTGKRSLDIARHPNPASMHPIRIIAGAFAPGVPERDLRVSPHHAIYIDGALMEAISLVNDATVIQEFETRFVTYHHIALETHDVILAEGLPAETYLETGSRNMFEGESSLVLHPNFQILGDADFCAPMIRAGAKLEAARARLLARAAFLGFTQTDDIDLTAQPRHGRA